MPIPPQDPSVLGALRQFTRPEHDRIEQLLALDGPMALGRYHRVIAGFHGFLARWEAEIAAALPERLRAWFAERSRLRFAADDLAFLDASAPPPRAGMAVDPPSGLPDAGLASVFGSLYVIEGSALGGQVIAPRLQRDMGLTPGRGASYFHGFGSGTGAMWREFREIAAAEIGPAPVEHARACTAARRTFGALIATFEPLLER